MRGRLVRGVLRAAPERAVDALPVPRRQVFVLRKARDEAAGVRVLARVEQDRVVDVPARLGPGVDDDLLVAVVGADGEDRPAERVST